MSSTAQTFIGTIAIVVVVVIQTIRRDVPI